MNTTNDGRPAFPVLEMHTDGRPRTTMPGMSLRDWFAGQALAGLLPKLPLIDQTEKLGIKVDDKIAHNSDIAESCYCIADAMLAAREGGAK